MAANEEVPTPTKITLKSNVVDITPKQDGGVLKEIIKEGEGDAFPASGCEMSVHYEGRLTDGTVFESTKPGQPCNLTLGTGLVKALDIGLVTMKKGEVAMLTCKPEYGHRNLEVNGIPAGSTLIFEITLIGWKEADCTEHKDGGIIKHKTFILGTGYSHPVDGAVVEVHLTGKCGNKIFEDRDLKFDMGEGCEVGVVDGVERALRNFKRGEKSLLKIKPKYAFKEEGNSELGVPPNASVEYIVELKNFVPPIRSCFVTVEEAVAQAKLLKDKATKYFKANKFGMAIKFYTKMADFADPEAVKGLTSYTELEEERKSLLLAARLNLGLAYLKLNQYYKAKKECDAALDIDPNNVKALFRRGQSYLEIGEPEKAKSDFESVVKLEPSNKLAASQIIPCCNKIKQHREKEKKIYANMFDKFARKDREKEELIVTQQPDTMKVLGEWGRDERGREPTEFEQENPDILMLDESYDSVLL